MKKELYPLSGIVSTVISPFTEGEKLLDLDCLANEINMACEAGVAGFLVPCLASEMPLLSNEEKRAMVETTARAANGRAKLITSITAPTNEERIRRMNEYLEYGVDGVNMQVPHETEEEFLKCIEAVDKAKPPFLLIQDADFNGPGIPVEWMVKAFEEFETVIGCKVEVKYNGPKFTALRQATGNKMIISSGWGNDQMLELLDRGLHAVMPSGLFELFVNIFKLHNMGNREGAKRLFFDSLPIIEFTRQSQELNRWFHKRYLRIVGAFATEVSREEVYLDEYHLRYADELIERAAFIRDHMDTYYKSED